MNIGRLSVTRPVAVTMRIAALVLLGLICLGRLPIDLLPGIEIPTVAVSVSWPNTAPEEMETQITRPLEQAVASVKGLDVVTSSSSLGSTFVRVQLNYGTDIDQAASDVLQAVQRAKGRFPRDPNISEPSVFKFDPSSLPIAVYGVRSSQMDLTRLRQRFINEIAPAIESAGGVATVNVTGGQDRTIQVEVDPAKLTAYGITLGEVSRRIQAENTAVPAGIAKEGKTQYTVRAYGFLGSLEELRKLPLTSRDGAQIRLSDVAEVRDGGAEIRQYTRMGGQPSLNLGITKQLDANTVQVSENVDKAIGDILKRNPDLAIEKVYDQAGFVRRSITDLQETAIIGGVLAILVITFFLRSLRSTVVVALSIPISIISTFSLLYFCGFTLNTISLSGLALATGLIVDDAIVVLEAIYRRIERTKGSIKDAAVEGTQEILSAVTSSTFTVMIVFLPLLLVQGQAGQTFTQFALVVIFSIGISLLDAVTVVPMLASRVIRRQDIPDEYPNPERPQRGFYGWAGRVLHDLDVGYRASLEWCLRHRGTVMAGALASVAGAALIWPHIGREQLPPTDSGNLTVRVRFPVGTSLDITNAAMKKVETALANDPDVATAIVGAGANVGLRGSGGAPSNEGSASVRLKDERKTETGEVVKRLQRAMANIPGARVQVQSQDVVANTLFGRQGGFGIEIYGGNLDQLVAKGREVQQALSEVEGLQNVDLDIQDATPEMRFSVDREKAQALGVSFTDAAATISAGTGGQLSSYYVENGFQYPINVVVPEALRQTAQQILALPVTSGNPSEGRPPVILEQVAESEYALGPNQISRQSRQRVVSVGGNIQDRAESDVQKDALAALEKVPFEGGTYWQLGRQQLQREKDYAGLGLAVFLAIALVYMLLATQFESFIYPLVVLSTVPLCAIGVVLALFLTGRSFGLTAFIGLLMLVGIVVKNGILLVDLTNALRRNGADRRSAILDAGPTRLRPILMTSLTAILGMLPLALGVGSGSEMYVPLATAVIGGLTTSTLLTLFVVPVVYTLFDDLLQRFGRSSAPVTS